ncbi:hypothetical protein PM082_011063 [Marasmius tenuissimus]|nr:hypothetical protein PM082_011063 [Marasmius tenuissimus]
MTKSEADKAIISRDKELAKKCGVPITQIVLAWMSAKIDSPIVGTSSTRHLKEHIPFGTALDDE